MTFDHTRLPQLQDHLNLLQSIKRGVEREGLRVTPLATLAVTDHPQALGSTLTHPYITTDYAEALLELITGTHKSVGELYAELKHIQQFVASKLDNEVFWNQSMPAHLPDEEDIRIGWYGPSNQGLFRNIYRRGLAERYGKRMQCIAGVHYNLSFPYQFWQCLQFPGGDLHTQRINGYLALIRNFTRYAWLLMYLFGASPVVSSDFLSGHRLPLEQVGPDTYTLPWATSLRMSGLGYQNKEAQAELQLCYNDLNTFLLRMRRAVTSVWPDYEKIGTHRNGDWVQLSNNILQIENEYYSNIRPKRNPHEGERPLSALANRGVEYVEVRCLDIDPYDPMGLALSSCYFLDTFLLFCVTEPSPFFADGGFCQDSKNNFAKVVQEGRRPGLLLKDPDTKEISLQEWGHQILTRMRPYAKALDASQGLDGVHESALAEQERKILNSSECPSARLLRDIESSGLSFVEYTLQQSQRQQQQLIDEGLPTEVEAHFEQMAEETIAQQKEIDSRPQTQSFEECLKDFEDALG